MALLPQEFGRAKEEAGPHLPTHHVAPLVAQHGQVPPAVDPVLIGIPDNGLRGGTHDELFFQLGFRVHHDAVTLGVVHEAVMGDHGALLGKACHVLRFPAEEALGDEEGEVRILNTRCLEHVVQDALHLFPDGVSVGLDNHASAYGGLLCQIGLYNQVIVPLGVVLFPFCYLFCHNFIAFFLFCA